MGRIGDKELKKNLCFFFTRNGCVSRLELFLIFFQSFKIFIFGYILFADFRLFVFTGFEHGVWPRRRILNLGSY